MKTFLLVTTLFLAGCAAQLSRAALLVYEPFNYPVGPLSGQGGGTGFADYWTVSSGGPTAGVYDQNTTNVSSGSETGPLALTWDGKVNNLPSLPTVGARFAAAQTNNSNFEIHRTLATDAGTMAAANGGVLWLSVAYHLRNLALGAGINIGLGSGYIANRGLAFSPSTAAYIGANSAFTNVPNPGFTYKLNAYATSSGWTSGSYVVTTNAYALTNLISSTNDLVVVLKYTLSATSNKVEACAFSENDTLSETAFNTSTNRVSTTLASGINPYALNVLSVAQGRMANAIDEIRIGQTFSDVISLPPAGAMDPNASTVTASPTNVFANGTDIATIKVQVTDSVGLPLAGKSVTLSSGSGYPTISPAGAQTTDTNGFVTFTATSTTANTEYFSAYDNTDGQSISQSAAVVFDLPSGDPSVSTVVASPTNVLANGTSASTITVTVKTTAGLPVAGKSITLSSSPGNAVISPAGSQTTGTNGQVTFTATSSTADTETFSAYDSSDSVTFYQSPSVIFSETNADPGFSTVVATPPGVYADGVSTSIVTVTLKNSSGLPLAGKSVTLQTAPSIGTFSPAGSQITDSNGVAVYTAKSATPGTVVLTVTNATDLMVTTNSAKLNFVALNSPVAINFNFYNISGGAPIIADPATLVGPNGGLGEVWNQTNSASATNLLSSLGITTSVGFISGTYSRWPWGSPALAMLRCGAAQFGTVTNYTFIINGLTPGGSYDVWIASAKMDTGSQGTWSTTNLTSSPTIQTVNNVGFTDGSDWLYGNNYVRFENVVADGSGQIAFTSVSGNGGQLPINGFQLVQTAPLALKMTPTAGSPGHLDFSWSSKAARFYDLVSTNDLSVPRQLWPAWNNETNVAATAPINTLNNIPGGSNSKRFFTLVERKSPVLFKTGFEQSNGGFTVISGDWAWGTPNSDNGSGLVITNGNGGSTNCWGTVLGDGGITSSGFITPGTDSILQSPPVSLNGITNASLSFAAAVDAASGDTINVKVFEAGSNTLLGTLTPITPPLSSGWTGYGPLDISFAAGKVVYVQFEFLGNDGSRLGLYIDDVQVSGQ